MLLRTVLLLPVVCVMHSKAVAFPAGFLDGLGNIMAGVGRPEDLFGVLFVPCVVMFVLTKRPWLKATTGVVWFLDLIVSPAYILLHLLATGMLVLITIFLRWIYTKLRLSST